MKDKKVCSETPQHQAHMAINGECPWCGTYDPDAETMSVEKAEAMFG